MSGIHGEAVNWGKSFILAVLLKSSTNADEIQWHDDGEKDLGPDIASWSLGGAATMGFRMKSKYWKFKERNADNYDPELPVRPGSQAWKERIALNELYQAGHMDEYEQAKTALFKALDKNKNNGPTVLSLELRHGDMVVMHGEDIQKNNEVCAPAHHYLFHIY